LNGYPIGNNPHPSVDQLSLVVRNINSGAWYTIWWDPDRNIFVIGTIISGNAPQDKNRAAVWYITK
jgi:hypothetical protein